MVLHFFLAGRDNAYLFASAPGGSRRPYFSWDGNLANLARQRIAVSLMLPSERLVDVMAIHTANCSLRCALSLALGVPLALGCSKSMFRFQAKKGMSMARPLWGSPLVASLSLGVHAQSGALGAGYTYKCTPNGVLIQFSSDRCPDGARRVLLTNGGPSTADTPHSARQANHEADLTSHGHYVNHAGKVVHSPSATVSSAVPAGASATCRDGTCSFSLKRNGTCQHHGRVARWI
jgi:hypothetical protein